MRDDTMPTDDDDPAAADRELPDEADMDQDDDDEAELIETALCPHCGKRLYESSQICPQCHNYVSFEEVSTQNPPWLIIAAGICLLIVLLYWVLR